MTGRHGFACVFDHVSGGAVGADAADVPRAMSFRGRALRQFASDWIFFDLALFCSKTKRRR